MGLLARRDDIVPVDIHQASIKRRDTGDLLAAERRFALGRMRLQELPLDLRKDWNAFVGREPQQD